MPRAIISPSHQLAKSRMHSIMSLKLSIFAFKWYCSRSKKRASAFAKLDKLWILGRKAPQVSSRVTDMSSQRNFSPLLGFAVHEILKSPSTKVGGSIRRFLRQKSALSAEQFAPTCDLERPVAPCWSGPPSHATPLSSSASNELECVRFDCVRRRGWRSEGSGVVRALIVLRRPRRRRKRDESLSHSPCVDGTRLFAFPFIDQSLIYSWIRLLHKYLLAKMPTLRGDCCLTTHPLLDGLSFNGKQPKRFNPLSSFKLGTLWMVESKLRTLFHGSIHLNWIALKK